MIIYECFRVERTADFGNDATFIIGICLIPGSMILRYDAELERQNPGKE